MAKIMAAGPYVGEFGWECFSWQPMIRQAFLRGGYDRCLAYSGPGRSWLYRFAETRTLPVPAHEPECLAWANPAAHKAELAELPRMVHEAAAAEVGQKVDVVSYTSISSLADPNYGAGQPDLLYPDEGVPADAFFRNDGRRKIVLCVRDRRLADHRNWGYERWGELADLLRADFDMVVVGKVERPHEWALPEGVNDFTNKTTVDDLIAVFSQADLAVGGSTGTLHLASRCGRDHLVWGAENSTKFPLSDRYAETNWFGAICQVKTGDAWMPEPKSVVEWVRGWPVGERKARVVITFDDCTSDHVNAAMYLSSIGLRGTFGAVTGKVSTPGFVTWDDLVVMSRRGHCVCNHSNNHCRLVYDEGRKHLRPVGRNGVTADAAVAREELNRRGLDGDYYMPPFGTGNVDGPDHLVELRGMFPWIRLTTGTLKGDAWTAEGLHHHSPSSQRGVHGLTAAADMRWPGRVRQRVFECVKAKTTCVLAYHRVGHAVGQEQDITWPEFRADMDYVAAHVRAGNVEVVTPKELI